MSHLQGQGKRGQVKESVQVCIDPLLGNKPGCKIGKIGSSSEGKNVYYSIQIFTVPWSITKSGWEDKQSLEVRPWSLFIGRSFLWLESFAPWMVLWYSRSLVWVLGNGGRLDLQYLPVSMEYKEGQFQAGNNLQPAAKILKRTGYHTMEFSQQTL